MLGACQRRQKVNVSIVFIDAADGVVKPNFRRLFADFVRIISLFAARRQLALVAPTPAIGALGVPQKDRAGASWHCEIFG
jgi:hypothetical protein